MIFELSFEHRDFSDRLGFFIQNIFSNYSDLVFSIFQKSDTDLRVWIEYEKIEKIEKIIEELSKKIPQSLYLGEVNSNSFDLEYLPKTLKFSKPRDSISFCPECLEHKEGICEVCAQERIPLSQAILEEITKELLEKKNICVKTLSGEHILTLNPSSRIYCLNAEKILEVCTPTHKELQALASYERPVLRVRPFNQEEEYVCISFAQDYVLHLLFDHLRSYGIDFLYGGSEAEKTYYLAESIKKSDEMVVYENEHFALLHTANIDTNLVERFETMQSLDKAFLSVIVAENQLEEKNILNFYFSKEGGDKVSLYNSQTQWFNEVMNFTLPMDLFALISQIESIDQTGEKLIKNYKTKFPHLLSSNIDFSLFPQGIYGIWEIAKIVLGFDDNPLRIAQKNLTKRGVAIDYVFEKDSVISHTFDLIRCIRSGMSFKLAGVEDELIALGYIESFSHLPSKLYIALRGLLDIDGISLCGDLFSNKMIGDFFYFNNHQVPIYRNKKFPLLYKR